MFSQKITNLIYFPMLVSENGTAEKTSPEAVASLWEKFHSLPQERQDILTARELPFVLKKLQESFRLNDQAIGHISLIVRKIFFDELSPEQAEAKIGSILVTAGGDPTQAHTIIEYIRTDILTIKPQPEEGAAREEKSSVATVSLPLLQALSKYEQLGNQLITQERIKIKSQSEPVRPSLVYWIKYYRDELGVGQHDSVQRGNFLFRSENGKRLSVEERERVNLILRSVEENYPLPIDIDKKEIIFPDFATPAPKSAPQSSKGQSIPQESPSPARNSEPFTITAAPAPVKEKMFSGNIAPTKPESYEKAWSPHLEGGFGIEQHVQTGGIRGVPVTAPASKGNMSFSSKHIFPAEKNAAPPAPSSEKRPESAPVSPSVGNVPPAVPTPRPQAPVSQMNPFRIRPVSSLKMEKEAPRTKVEE